MAFRVDLLERQAADARRRAIGWAVAAALALGAVAGAAGAVWLFFFSGMPAAPDARQLWSVNRAPGVEFRDAAGRTIATRGARYGEAVRLNQLPRYVPQAFLAVEDHRFFEHGGVDVWAVLRAAQENVEAQRVVQGGSTITQQLVKTLFLTPDRTLRRKVQEARLAWEIERRVPKEEILTIYLNRIFFGEQAYGVDAAARRYFAKRATELTLPEAALLAGLPKAPSRLAPDENPAAAYERMRLVLIRMAQAGFITAQERDRAIQSPPPITPARPLAEGDLGWALDAAARRVREVAPDAPGDLIVELTIDPALQAAAEDALGGRMAREGPGLRVGQAALVALAPDGAVRALVGGRSYAESKFNRATQARRQPGSAFKPFVYAAAFENGIGPGAVRTDRALSFSGWRPRNYAGGYSGPMTLRAALIRSVNTIPAALAAEVGIDRVNELARRFGIGSPLKANLSTALGASEVTLLELTGGFATLAAQGRKTPPYLIRSVRTSHGRVLFERPASVGGVVYDPDRAAELIQVLRGVVSQGTATRARLPGWQAAGKTGTSQDHRDAWFVGFTAHLTAGVWVGNDDFRPMARVTGGQLPALIWRDFMVKAHEGVEPIALPVPGGAGRGAAPEAFVAFYQQLDDLFAQAAIEGERTAAAADAAVATP